MPIDTSILGSYRPPQAENLFNTLTQFEAIRSAQQQRQLNALQLQKAQREQEQEQATNALLGEPGMFDPETGEINYGAIMQAAPRYGLGSQVPKYAEMQLKQKKASREAEEARFKASQERTKAVVAELNEIRKMYSQVNSKQGALAVLNATYNNPVVGPWLREKGRDLAESVAEIEALSDEEFPSWLARSSQALDDVVKQQADSAVINDAWRDATKYAKPTTDKPLFDGETEEGRRIEADKQSMYAAFVDRLQTRGRLDLAEKWLDQNKKLAMLPYAGLPPRAAELEAMRRHPELRAVEEALNAAKAPKQIFNLGDKVQAKYGEALAGKVADKDVKLLEAAEKAPDLSKTADRILALVQDPQLITGFGAEFRLNAARALNIVGLSDDETVRNTELLISTLGSQTLNAIQESGLGTGQGFTDKDRIFLQEAKAGRIEFSRDTLARMARLARKAAEKSAERWNERRKRMPAEVRDSMGLPEEVIIKPFDPKAAEIDEELLGGPSGQLAPNQVRLKSGRIATFPSKKSADEFRRQNPE